MHDKIFIQDLETKGILGIFDWERKTRQKIRISLEFPADIRRAARRDNIKDTIDYKRMAKETLAFVSQSRFYLIETLAEKLAAKILKEFRLPEIKVRVSKPGAVRGSRDVGVEITRKRK